MFTTSRNPIAAYKQVDFDAAVQGSDPHQLIVLLFDAADASLDKAREQIEGRDILGKTASLNKATEIILDGLVASLNVEQGGELAEKLKALYLYMVGRLVDANVKLDPAAVTEVQSLLKQLSEAWREIGSKQGASGTAA
jgi:flagellar secretion chaperone FliS